MKNAQVSPLVRDTVVVVAVVGAAFALVLCAFGGKVGESAVFVALAVVLVTALKGVFGRPL